MEEYKITSHSDNETIAIAQNIESEKFPNMVICLNGDLGSGKTMFTKGFAHAMGIDDITSPTFTIIKEYVGELPLYHMDVYRLDKDSNDIGIEDYFSKGGVTLIEWSDIITDILPDERLQINIKVISENGRVFELIPYGEKYEELCNFVL